MGDSARERVGNLIASASGSSRQLEQIAYRLADENERLRTRATELEDERRQILSGAGLINPETGKFECHPRFSKGLRRLLLRQKSPWTDAEAMLRELLAEANQKADRILGENHRMGAQIDRERRQWDEERREFAKEIVEARKSTPTRSQIEDCIYETLSALRKQELLAVNAPLEREQAAITAATESVLRVWKSRESKTRAGDGKVTA